MFCEMARDKRARRWTAVAGKSGEVLMVDARPLRLVEMVCKRLVDGVRIADGALLLDADPSWAGAINTGLVKRGVRVSELRRAEDRAAL
jgi:hypothetical protein